MIPIYRSSIVFLCPSVVLLEQRILARFEKWLPMAMMKSLATSTMDCVRMGLRAHVRLAWPGILVDCSLAPAHLSDTEGAEDLLQGVAGFVLADRNYWKPELSQRLKSYGLYLLAPYKSAKHEKQAYPRYLTHMRYRIETVFGQLVERFHAKRIWARDLWHLTSRWMRKFLSHTLAVYLCSLADISYLSFAKLVSA